MYGMEVTCLYREGDEPTYEILKHKKLLANYYKKFQKHEKALEVLMDVYKAERKIYNATVKKSDQISALVEEPKSASPRKAGDEAKVVEMDQEDQKEEEKDVHNDAVEIVTEKSEQDKERSYQILQSQLSKRLESVRKSRNIKVRLGMTMIEIMSIYGTKRDKLKARRFKDEAAKYILEGVDGNKNHMHFIKYLSTAGDMHVKWGSKKDLDDAYNLYSEANKALEVIVGKKSIDFILSMVDIGDVHLERKSYEEAEAFYQFCKSQLEENYGKDCIFKHRINSALVEVYSAAGGENRAKAYECAMENVEIAMLFYEEQSIF